MAKRKGVRLAAGGGRWVEVPPVRLERWLTGFDERHRVTRTEQTGYGVRLDAADGAYAECHPLIWRGWDAGVGAAGLAPRALLTAAGTGHRIGLLLARQGAVAVGVAVGPELVTSKVDTRYVQGRTAAGGWSQQRFARRRANQAQHAARSAAELVVRILLPEHALLATVVTGGDRRAVAAVLADPRLAALADSVNERFLTVPEPRQNVLRDAIGLARMVKIRVKEPDRRRSPA